MTINELFEVLVLMVQDPKLGNSKVYFGATDGEPMEIGGGIRGHQIDEHGKRIDVMLLTPIPMDQVGGF